MNPKYFNILASISALMSAGTMLSPTQAYAQQQGPEELTRGPIHEAFASSVSYNPEPGILIRQSPPEMIDEIPPEQRLEGDNVSWIPGYWAWDGDQEDFIWISGIWRKLPPGRQWNPGYWGQVEDQFQWTSGYWADEERQEVSYLPRPPKSLESGPNIPAPSDNDIWISGNWTHRNDRYGWTPGYWEPAQQDWIWIPAHYQWTRRGYVYIDGYWDYNVSRRGVMFAPVRFQGDSYRRPGYSYTPLLVISVNVLLDHLFVRPSYGHYYFGDYYSNGYRDNGYYSSYSYSSGRRGYDPIYSHNRWEHRDDRDWDRKRLNDFNFYRDNENDRPARTWAAMQDRKDKNKDKRGNYVIAQPLSVYAEQETSGQRFQKVDSKSRESYVEQRKQIRDYSQQRRQIESKPRDEADKDSDKVIKEKLPKSPVFAKRSEQSKGKDVPPERIDSPTPDRKDSDKRDEKSDDRDNRDKRDRDDKGNQDNRDKTEKPDSGSDEMKEKATPTERDKDKGRDKDKEPKDAPDQKDTPRQKNQDESDKKDKSEPKQEKKKEEEMKRTPDRETREKPPQPERPESDPRKERKAEPESRKKSEPTPEKRPESSNKRQPERVKPERNPEPEPEAAPAPKPPRESSEKSSGKKGGDSGDGEGKEKKKK
jgi:hypothetical protein